MKSDDLVRIYVPRDDGAFLENYEDRPFHKFHGVVPQIGDHLTHTPGWIGGPTETDGNLFLVVIGRFFMADGIALICEHRDATAAEYELF